MIENLFIGFYKKIKKLKTYIIYYILIFFAFIIILFFLTSLFLNQKKESFIVEMEIECYAYDDFQNIDFLMKFKEISISSCLNNKYKKKYIYIVQNNEDIKNIKEDLVSLENLIIKKYEEEENKIENSIVELNKIYRNSREQNYDLFTKIDAIKYIDNIYLYFNKEIYTHVKDKPLITNLEIKKNIYYIKYFGVKFFILVVFFILTFFSLTLLTIKLIRTLSINKK
jgi:hypothetical protein